MGGRGLTRSMRTQNRRWNLRDFGAWGAAGVDRGRRCARGEAVLFSILLQGVALLALAAGTFSFCRTYLIQSVCVQGTSMLPTLRERHWYLASPLVLRWREPRPGDIVVLRDPAEGSLVVKRVVAAAGDRVELRNGGVYVNGRRLEEPYLLPGTFTWPVRRQWSRVTCGPGEYYVLGDNRAVSADSREYGPVPRGAVLGIVLR